MSEKFPRQNVNVENPQLLAKWDSRVLAEGFVPFPKRLLRCLSRIFNGEKSLDELAVVLAIVDYKRPDLSRPPSPEFLAFLLDIPVDRFRSILESLRDKALISFREDETGLEIEISGLTKKILELTPSSQSK